MSGDVCTYCGKPVIPFVEASYGDSGNHYDCHDMARKEAERAREAIELVQHVTLWYRMLGSSEAEAAKRVAQERRLIAQRTAT